MCMYDDVNVCFMHVGLLGGRCIGRRCRVLLKHPDTLCGGCICQKAIAARGAQTKLYYICVIYCPVIFNVQLLYCLAHLHNFSYLLMWHFCYTVHVSFI